MEGFPRSLITFDFATFEGLIGLELDPTQNHYVQSQTTGLADGASQVSIRSRMFIQGVDDRQFLFGTSSGGGSTNEYQLKIWHQDGEFRIGITDDAEEERPYTGINAADYFFGWHDYKVTYNAGKVAFFIDDEELWNYSTGGSALAALDYPLMISTRNEGYDVGHRTLDGRVAELVMEVGGEEIVRWNLDEGEGDTATDSSGNNNHGTIVGATWVVPEPPVEPEEIPALNIVWDGNNHVISWDGSGFTLEAADEITGPWSALDGETSPYAESEEAARRFYRLRAQ